MYIQRYIYRLDVVSKHCKILATKEVTGMVISTWYCMHIINVGSYVSNTDSITFPLSLYVVAWTFIDFMRPGMNVR